MSGPRLYGKHMLLGRLRAGHAPPLLRSQNEKGADAKRKLSNSPYFC